MHERLWGGGNEMSGALSCPAAIHDHHSFSLIYFDLIVLFDIGIKCTVAY